MTQFKVLTQFEEDANIPGVEFHDKKCYNKTEEYEMFFEIGSEVLVKCTKEEIGNSGWRPDGFWQKYKIPIWPMTG